MPLTRAHNHPFTHAFIYVCIQTTWDRPVASRPQESERSESKPEARVDGAQASYEEKLLEYLASNLSRAAKDSNPDVSRRSLR